MNKEVKQCQNCRVSFTIEPEDFKFYEKMQVPPPTFCPECRMQRRMAFRNERNLYKRNCNLCGKEIISMHQKSAPVPVYCQNCWWSDKWDASGFGRDFNTSKPFLEQFAELQKLVPLSQYLNVSSARVINSPYTNCAGDIENCYLIFGALNNRNCAYSHYIEAALDSFDMLYSEKVEKCYEGFDIDKSYKVFFSQSSQNCVDSMFLFDCRNCNNCIGCAGLRNKSYHILNEPHSKEEYLKKKEELKLNTTTGIERFRKRFFEEVYYKIPRKYYHGQMNSGFTGDYISNTEKTYHSFYIKNTRNNKFCFWCINGQDVYDYFAWGDLEKSYEVVSSGEGSYNIKFSNVCWGQSKDIEYSSFCIGGSNLFGCISLRNKQYCILNKQYTKEEYEILRGKIVKQMKEMPYKGKDDLSYGYGEFMPIELSPSYYNDTVAQEHFPLTKEEALAKGYLWNEGEKGIYSITKKADELPQNIKEVGDEILNEVIECKACKRPYRIIESELKFYREQDLPLPQLCPDSRHLERVKYRNPLKFWQRQCACDKNHEWHKDEKCANEFETSYSPERMEMVCCEKCYTAEIA